jgi:hypothetical protein
MPRPPSEEVKLYQIRLGLGLAKTCEDEAAETPERLPPSVFLRRIAEDYLTLYGIPRSQFEELEQDRKEMKLDKREYIKELLDARLRLVREKKPGGSPPPRKR